MTEPPFAALTLSLEAAEAAATEADRWHPRETGGVLVGAIVEGCVRVEQAVGPGPQAVHERNFFLRDQDYAEQQVDLLHERSGGRVDYIGEWHSHSRIQGPSATDITSMLQISRDLSNITSDSSNSMPFPVLVIAMRERRHWVFKAYVPRQGELIEMPAEVAASGNRIHVDA